MGRKVHPVGFRIGGIRDWQATWYAEKNYAESLHEDLRLRHAIQSEYAGTGISQVQIDRQANTVAVTIHTSRPGVVIGRGGQDGDREDPARGGDGSIRLYTAAEIVGLEQRRAHRGR